MKHPAVRLACLALAAGGLVCGIAAGLARLGLVPAAVPIAAQHAALVISGFLGTVISLERAVAFGGRAAYAAPLAGGIGTVALLAGAPAVAATAWIAAPLALLAVSALLVRRQPLPHMALLLVAAAAWAAGNALYVAGRTESAIPWWFAFLVLTIAAERLEMTRLLRRRPGAHALFALAAAALLAGAALAVANPAAGGVLFGAALCALAAWLAVFDLARRTRASPGFAGYSAHALLAGYAWLGVGGLAWIAMSQGALSFRDAALHAIALGFVMSMIFGHAPLIVPAVAGRRLRFTPAFYAPLVLLHLSVAARVGTSLFAPELRPAAGVSNAFALAAFAGLLAWSLRGGRRGTQPESPHAAH